MDWPMNFRHLLPGSLAKFVLFPEKVAMEGFMVPTVVNEENMVKEFLLMPDQLSCCFGQAPEANGWVVARSEKGVDVAMDRVITYSRDSYGARTMG